MAVSEAEALGTLDITPLGFCLPHGKKPARPASLRRPLGATSAQRVVVKPADASQSFREEGIRSHGSTSDRRATSAIRQAGRHPRTSGRHAHLT